jgi:hypothetical protein
MDIEALRSILSAVRRYEAGRRVVIFGSSALLITLSGASPADLGVETTLDADLLLDPDDESVRRVLDEAIGSDSEYDVANGFHADFVDARIADDCFPRDWRERLVPVPGFDGVFALSSADTAAAKLLATAFARLNRRMGRATADRGLKDISAIAALLRASLLDAAELHERLESVELSPALVVEAGNVFEETKEAAGRPS